MKYSMILFFLLRCCFSFAEGVLPGTLIATAYEGLVPVEQIEKGMPLWCLDPVSKLTIKRKVVSVKQVKVRFIVEITIAYKYRLFVANNQKLYDPEAKEWMRADEFNPGDWVLARDGEWYEITDVQERRSDGFLYAISVGAPHVVCIGDLGIVAHNFIPIAVGFSLLSWGAGEIGIISGTQLLQAVAGGVVYSLLHYGIQCVGEELFKTKCKHKKCFKGYSSSPMPPEDPEDKRKNKISNWRPLSNKEAFELAEQLGYEYDPSFKTKSNVPVFRKGRKWITPDSTGHKGGSWKMFTKNGGRPIRLGTFNLDLSVKIGN
jgi:hypothetical protein